MPMIKNATIFQEVRDEWKFAITTQNSINVTMGFYEKRADGAYFDHFLNLIHGFVLTFAFSVLQNTLEQLRDEGVFNCGGNILGNLMNASNGKKSKMKWLNFPLVDEGRDKRNKLVHCQKFLKRTDTWKYIDAIEKELIGWKVLDRPEERWGYRGV
jgi:hypothetical protein